MPLQQRLLAGEISTYSREKRYIRKDGSPVWVNVTISLVRDPSGGPKYLAVVVRDITERKRQQDLLTARERQQAAIAQIARRALAGTALADLMRQATALVAQTLDVEYCKVLMDLTGVAAIDIPIANRLVQTVEAARLLGASVIVSGLSREITRALVQLGVDFGSMRTARDSAERD